MPASKQKPTKKLNPKQRLFVAEYLIDRNAAKAYVRAGYAEENAETHGPRLARNGQVKAEIEKRLGAIYKKLEVDKERSIEEVSILAYSDVQDYMKIGEDGSQQIKTFEEMPPGASRAIKTIDEKTRIISTPSGDAILERNVKLVLHDKIVPNKMLGNEVGAFTDKLEVEGGPFVIVKRDYEEADGE